MGGNGERAGRPPGAAVGRGGEDEGGAAVRVAVQTACTRGPSLPRPALLRRWARAAIGAGAPGVEGEVTIRLVDEAEGVLLNRRYRDGAAATNVLAFASEAPPVLGDVVICVPVAEREARDQGKSLEAHLAHLAVHGCLHLLGFDHGTDAQARRMEGLEVRVLGALGFADPYGPEGNDE